MLAFLPLSAWAMTQYAFYLYLRGKKDLPARRVSFVLTHLIFGLMIASATEALSFFHSITTRGVAGLWAVVFFISFSACTVLAQKQGRRVRPLRPPWKQADPLLLAPLIIMIITLLIIALTSPPNYWDALTYQMPRVFHWAQNQSVAFFPTNSIRQLFLSPWNEYLILHFQVLCGNDRLANFATWTHMLGSLIGVSLIARQLGAKGRGQMLASLITATIPMGIYQATTTQTDYGAALWLTYFVYFLLERNDKRPLASAVKLGGTLGLAIFAKPIAAVFAFPFFLWCIFRLFKESGKKAWLLIMLTAMVALSVNLMQFKRNYDLFGHPLGQKAFLVSVRNSSMTPALFASNILRHIGLHLATPFDPLNRFLRDSMIAAHQALNLSEEQLSPTTQILAKTQPYFEDLFFMQASTLHFLLFIFGGIFIAATGRKQNSGPLWFYWFSLVAGFLIFCLFFKYSHHNRRYHLTLLVLFSPLAAATIDRLFQNKRHLLGGVGLLFFTLSLPWLFFSPQRHLWGGKSIFSNNRSDQYFTVFGFDKSTCMSVVHFLRKHQLSQIGLISGNEDNTYSFFMLLKQNLPYPFRIEHVKIQNESIRLRRYREFHPEVIVSFQSPVEKPPPRKLKLGMHTFRRIRRFGDLLVYIRRK